MERSRTWTLIGAAAAYVLFGTGTAMLAAAARSPAAVTGWRALAWLGSLAVFGIHFVRERRRRDGRTRAATRVALAVALGAAGVAALGPLRAHWQEPGRLRLTVLSVLAWPLLTGIPAFAVALVGEYIGDRWASRTSPSQRDVA